MAFQIRSGAGSPKSRFMNWTGQAACAEKAFAFFQALVEDLENDAERATKC